MKLSVSQTIRQSVCKSGHVMPWHVMPWHVMPWNLYCLYPCYLFL